MVVMRNMTFGDLCRSNGGSYDFGAMETFDQHANIYQYAHFNRNITGWTFPIGKFRCPLELTLYILYRMYRIKPDMGKLPYLGFWASNTSCITKIGHFLIATY